MSHASPKDSPPPLGEDLPELTPKQAAFVKGILDGLSASESYRRAYDCENVQPHNIWALASRLRANVNVRSWLAAARRAGLDRAAQSVEDHIAELNEVKQMAIDLGDAKTALKAVEDKGRVGGLYIDRSEVTINDPARILHEIAAINPNIAQTIADQYRIPIALPSQPQPQTIEASPASQPDEQDDD